MYQWSMMKNIHSPNLVGICSGGPEIWPHEYLFSPIEISVNWPGFNSYEPGQFTLISMGVFMLPYIRPPWTNSCQIWCSCCHISGHHEPIHVKFGVWKFFIMFYWNMVMKLLKCKKENLMTSHFSTLSRAWALVRLVLVLSHITLTSIQIIKKKERKWHRVY